MKTQELELFTEKDNKLVMNEEGIEVIDYIVGKYEEAKEQYDAVKKALQEAMEKTDTIKIENDYFRVNYIAPTERENFDKKKFREEHAELYDEYIEFKPVKASVRIKRK